MLQTSSENSTTNAVFEYLWINNVGKIPTEYPILGISQWNYISCSAHGWFGAMTARLWPPLGMQKCKYLPQGCLNRKVWPTVHAGSHIRGTFRWGTPGEKFSFLLAPTKGRVRPPKQRSYSWLGVKCPAQGQSSRADLWAWRGCVDGCLLYDSIQNSQL